MVSEDSTICSVLTAANIGALYVQYDIPASNLYSVPREHDKACSSLEGFITIYEVYLRSGLCLSLLGDLFDVLVALGVLMARFHANAIRWRRREESAAAAEIGGGGGQRWCGVGCAAWAEAIVGVVWFGRGERRRGCGRCGGGRVDGVQPAGWCRGGRRRPKPRHGTRAGGSNDGSVSCTRRGDVQGEEPRERTAADGDSDGRGHRRPRWPFGKESAVARRMRPCAEEKKGRAEERERHAVVAERNARFECFGTSFLQICRSVVEVIAKVVSGVTSISRTLHRINETLVECLAMGVKCFWDKHDESMRIGLRSKLLSVEDVFVKIRSEDPFVRAVIKLDAIKQSLDCRMEAQGAVEVVSSCYGAEVI
ncbi:hypothetical protein Nepgr_019667 [Nepenthes gracilis]|uniref:Uncharacterized protein n=1 Tax=Nepenthes gracilis TaxID=150966 RepID=A0AAD3SXI3_NEPGR|nr:hypothetical protein Nepgr_019667 [Nepenthes gracilis]